MFKTLANYVFIACLVGNHICKPLIITLHAMFFSTASFLPNKTQKACNTKLFVWVNYQGKKLSKYFLDKILLQYFERLKNRIKIEMAHQFGGRRGLTNGALFIHRAMHLHCMKRLIVIFISDRDMGYDWFGEIWIRGFLPFCLSELSN